MSAEIIKPNVDFRRMRVLAAATNAVIDHRLAEISGDENWPIILKKAQAAVDLLPKEADPEIRQEVDRVLSNASETTELIIPDFSGRKAAGRQRLINWFGASGVKGLIQYREKNLTGPSRPWAS